METTNPFTLSFGKKPSEYIARLSQTEEILSSFQASLSPHQVYMITGVRGAGKTVMMANIANELRADSRWIVVELSPERDLLHGLAARLYHSSLQSFFHEASIDLSFMGIGITINGASKITDVETAIERMLKVLKKKDKRLLITIDEAVNNKNVREFASLFQIYMRQEYPVYLLMTGLYEHIYDLQNEKTLTFLYRAPKMVLQPLNAGAVIQRYEKLFDISADRARKMAELTQGYPFAFQVLGYLCWEQGGADYLERVLPIYDQYLDEYVYSKIWAEMSETDKILIKTMIEMKETRVTRIRQQMAMTPEKFSVYRKRLIQKGVVTGESYGEIRLTLPRFDCFVKNQVY